MIPAPMPAGSVSLIIEVVAAASGIGRRELLSRRRARRTVEARQAAMWLARQAAGRSYPAIGRVFNRDHTTVIYGVSRTEQRMATDYAFAVWVRSLEAAWWGLW
jgi:chromosomal replication initiator protein